MSTRKKPLFQRVDAPRNVRPVVKVLKLGSDEHKVFICLSPRPWGFSTHWLPGVKRTQPCIAHRAKCEHCVKLLPRRDRGYLLAATHDGCVMGFVDLTPEAFDMAKQIESAAGSLRGLWLRLYRRPATLRGAMILERDWQNRSIPEMLPNDCDPEPSLRRIWGLDNVA